MHLRRHIWLYLTIAQAGERSYPLIAPIGSVSSAKFLPEIPLSVAATVIIPGEVIPNYKDLKTLTSTIEEAYKEGSRSAEVKFWHNGVEICMIYHFSKVRTAECVTLSSLALA